jgi:hypothetical protein
MEPRKDTFELALKGTGHPTDLSIDCTFKRSVKSNKECLVSLFRPSESALKFLIDAKIAQAIDFHMRL